MWGISRCSGAPGVTIDWWRHVRETIDPVDYLSRPYFDSWAQTELATHIAAGSMSLDEVVGSRSATPPLKQSRTVTVAEALAADRTQCARYDRPIADRPRFTPGDGVRAKQHASPHHTRLPAYVRGHRGAVHAHHGGHLFPDDGAKAVETVQHLYTVVFDAGDLWPEARRGTDRVFLDLWESYLERA